MGGAFVAGPGGHEVQIAVDAVGGEGLCAADDPLVSITPRSRFAPGHVRTGARLSNRKGAAGLAANDARQVVGFLLRGADAGRPWRGHVGVDDDAECHAPGATPSQLFGQDDRHPEVCATPAVVLRVFDAQEAQLAHLLEQGAGYEAVFLPLVDVWRDLRFDETAKCRAK